jgi:hypothetical protein
MTCTQCEQDAMYDRRNGKRCANCGHVEQPTLGLIDERPTKPYDAVCGEVIEEWREHDSQEPKEVKSLCNDGSCCSFNPTTMRQLEDGTWIAVCTTHDK